MAFLCAEPYVDRDILGNKECIKEGEKNMIMTAIEMYRKTMISNKAKELMDNVMKRIMKESSDGYFALRMAVDDRDKNDHEIIRAVQNELIAAGYRVKFDPATPLPSGCPSDQWDFYAYLNVNWGKDVIEEDN